MHLRMLTFTVGRAEEQGGRRSPAGEWPLVADIEMLWGERRGQQGIIVAGNNRWGAPCRSRMT
jgi:hypothetical protein